MQSLPNCRFAPETQKCPKPDPAVWFRGDFGRFLSICAALFWRRYPYRPSFKRRCLSLPGNKKAPYCYDAFVLLGSYLIVMAISIFCTIARFCLFPLSKLCTYFLAQIWSAVSAHSAIASPCAWLRSACASQHTVCVSAFPILRSWATSPF